VGSHSRRHDLRSLTTKHSRVRHASSCALAQVAPRASARLFLAYILVGGRLHFQGRLLRCLHPYPAWVEHGRGAWGAERVRSAGGLAGHGAAGVGGWTGGLCVRLGGVRIGPVRLGQCLAAGVEGGVATIWAAVRTAALFAPNCAALTEPETDSTRARAGGSLDTALDWERAACGSWGRVQHVAVGADLDRGRSDEEHGAAQHIGSARTEGRTSSRCGGARGTHEAR
jgi:hypothetical protein